MAMPLSIVARKGGLSLSHRRPFAEKFRTSLRKRWYGRKRAPGAGRPVRCRYFGAEFVVNLDDEVGYEIALNRFEWRELKLMLDACKRLKPALFIDVGANLGLYSCVLGRHKSVPRILALEPDRENFSRLSANVTLNRLGGIVELHEAGAGAKAGTARLLPGGPANRGVSRIGAEPASDAYEVPIVALDELVDLDGGNLVVKIDVEGYEIEVLAGAARLLTRNGGFAQIESHGDRAAGVVTELMATFGWKFVERYGLDVRFEKA